MITLSHTRLASWRISILVAALFSIILVPARAQAGDGHNSDSTTSLLIKLHSGITLNYVVQGDPKGPVILQFYGRARVAEGAHRQVAHGGMRLRVRLGARASSRCQARAIMYDAQDRYRRDSRPGSRGYHWPSTGFAEAEAMPARTDRAINTDAIVFMARTPYARSGQHLCRP